MKQNQIMIALAVIILSGIGFFVYSNNQTAQKEALMKQEETAKDDSVMQKEEGTESEAQELKEQKDAEDNPVDSSMMKADSRYKPYSKAVLDGAAKGRRVLFFYASWCPTCRPADADFSENDDEIPNDVTLIRVNYNDPDTDAEEKALAKKYGVTYQHTYVQIDAAGKEITKWNGGKLEELTANIK